MMNHSKTKLFMPGNFEEMTSTVKYLEKKGEKFQFIAGGSDVVPRMKDSKKNQGHMVSLKFLKKTSSITIKEDEIHLGSFLSLDQIASDSALKEACPIIGKVASMVGSPQIRNQATLGGNILVDNRCVFFNQSVFNKDFHHNCFKDGGSQCILVKGAKANDAISCRARSVSDLTPALLVLDAKLVVKSIRGERTISAREFFKEDGIAKNNLETDEVLISVIIPRLHKSVHYKKLTVRKTLDFPSLGVALAKNEQGFEVAVCGIFSMPMYFNFVFAGGKSLSSSMEESIKNVTSAAPVFKQDFFPPKYRKEMLGVYIKELFER
ncbi:MAG: hypothetical protein HOE90_15515 [Bacteriovoracaceae bacterium]|nr:hypothetical protein [Bacteriovoracaceae bacterium]